VSTKNPQLKKKESHGIEVSQMQYFISNSGHPSLLLSVITLLVGSASTVWVQVNKPNKVPREKNRVKTPYQSPSAIMVLKVNVLIAWRLK
jgi:hypothetical protein